MYKRRKNILEVEKLRAEVFPRSKSGIFEQENLIKYSRFPLLKFKNANGNLYYIDTSNIRLNGKKIGKNGRYGKPAKKGKFLDKGQIYYGANYCFNGDCYDVYDKAKEGLCIPILDTSLEILYHAKEKWKRVCMIRFDLHQKGVIIVNSSHVSRFVKNLNRRIERHEKYRHIPFYIWVREVGKKEGGQHYHFALFLNGNKVNKSKGVSRIVEEVWKNINIKNNFYLPKNSYLNINGYSKNQDEITDKTSKAVYRLSYLAKIDTKTENPLHKNNYSSSRIKKQTTKTCC